MSDEIREEQLDAPLVVHKKSDASYQDGGINVDMNETHIEEEKKPTLERHRFKKDPNKKSNKAPVAISLLLPLFFVLFILQVTFHSATKVQQKLQQKPLPKQQLLFKKHMPVLL